MVSTMSMVENVVVDAQRCLPKCCYVRHSAMNISLATCFSHSMLPLVLFVVSRKLFLVEKKY